MAHSHSVREYPAQLTGIVMLSAAVGALMGMLFAPKRGNEMRQQMKQRAMTAKDRMQQSSAASSVKDTASQISETAQHAKKRAASTAAKVKQDAKDTAKETKSTAKKAKSSADDVTDHIRRNGEP